MQKLLTLFTLISTIGLANPFDTFIGTYKFRTKPQITEHNMNYCYGLEDITELNISKRKYPNNKNETHTIDYVKSNGYGVLFSVEDYMYQNEMGLGGSSAETIGSSNTARNVQVSWDRFERNVSTVEIQKTDAGIFFRLNFDNIRNGQVYSSCYRQVELLKQ